MNIKNSSYKDIHCPHFIFCSGCTIDENVNHPPLLDEVHDYFQEKTLPFTYFSDHVVGWRYRAKLAVRGSVENPQVGLYEAGTHHVVDIPLCRVHHPLINLAMEHVKTWIRLEKIEPYDEMTQKGLLRYIQCVIERSTGRVQLTFVINASNADEVSSRLLPLWDHAPELWHSMWVNLNTKRTNTIFSDDWRLLKGEEDLWETLAHTKVCFHPANFAQANLPVFEKMLTDLKNQITPGKHITEYYAGVGVIGLCLAEIAQSVTCCEVNPFAKASFEKAYQLQKPSPQISFVTGVASEHLKLLEKADIVVVDPPRKGLDRSLLKALVENKNLNELWYVSCGWSSFKQDCEALLESWKLHRAQAYLFFPGTDHLEILAKFERLP